MSLIVATDRRLPSLRRGSLYGSALSGVQVVDGFPDLDGGRSLGGGPPAEAATFLG